jgi:aminoglycoside phosphotransferase (APT) family kinase protein
VPTGVVDLSRSFVGHPLADLGAIWWGILERDRDALRQFLATSGLDQHGPHFERHALAWALMTPPSGTPDLDDVERIDDPAELAERWFGGHPGSLDRHGPRSLDEPAEAAFHPASGVDESAAEAPILSATTSPGQGELIEQLESLSRSEDAYRLARHETEPWTRAAGVVSARHGLPVDGPLQPVESGSRPAIRVPRGHIIKFYGPWDWGDILFDREVQALRWLDDDPALPVTRLVATGWLSEDWRYAVLSWLDGSRLKDVDEGLWSQDASGLLTWLGRFVRALHALPLEPDAQEAGLVEHREILAYRHREAARRAGERHLLPQHLLAQIDAWLPPLEELIDLSPGGVLVHADVTPSNIIGEAGASGFRPTRIIDFNQSVVAHALYELGPIWWTILEGHPERTRAFLSEAQLPGMPDAVLPRQALAWALLNPAWRPQPFTWLDSVHSLDDVARRAFGDDAG